MSKKLLIFALIIAAVVLMAAYANAKMGLGLGMGLGSGSVSVSGQASGCDAGYDAVTGSDTNIIHDSLGASICAPQ